MLETLVMLKYDCKQETGKWLKPRRYTMSDFHDRLLKAAGAASVGGSVGASIGGSVVSAVSGIGGSVFGPAGTFFGAAVGTGVGASVGGAIGAVSGFFGALLSD